jgi:virulence factor Mce-like protein
MGGRRGQRSRISPFGAGLLTIVLITLVWYFAFTGANPFSSPFELNAVFQTSSNLSPRSPVRVAGIQVGKVTEVEALPNGTSRVRMELEDRGLPIHADTQLKIRPRLFLGGNFVVDLHAGSPSAPILDDGATIPLTQTQAPVQLGDVIADLQADTRRDLQVALQELAKALEDAGADGLRGTIAQLEPAYRRLALASDASLGEEPARDLRRVLRGTHRTTGGFARNEPALKDLVTHLGQTLGALARQDDALEASVPALRDALRTAQPALASANDALPPLRALAREALPGVRRSGPVLEAALPAIRQARALVGEAELRGALRALRSRVPDLVRLTDVARPVFEQGRAASRCTARVLVPFISQDFPDPDFPANTGTVNQKLMRSLVGLSGESRTFDGFQSYFHVSQVPSPMQVRPAPPPDPTEPPVHRPDVPCETQEPPNLEAPAARIVPVKSGEPGLIPLPGGSRAESFAPPLSVRRKALLDARQIFNRHFEKIERKRERLLRKGGFR